MKRAARTILRAATHLLERRILEKSVVVFIYHDISDAPSRFNSMFGLNVRPSIFSIQLDLIREHFHIVGPVQLVRGDYQKPAALITFDDGNLSYFRNALPILKEKGIPSLAFLNAGPIRGEVCRSGLGAYLQNFEPVFYGPRGYEPGGYDFCQFTEPEVYRYLDSVDADALLERVRAFRGPIAGKEDLEAVSTEPLVYLGNHLYNHYNATLLFDRLKDEYWKNQSILDDHPRGVRLFSYPFSRHNDETTRIIRAQGAEAIFTVGGLPNVGGKGDMYYRVELSNEVVAGSDMVSEVTKNYLAAKLKGRIRSSGSGHLSAS